MPILPKDLKFTTDAKSQPKSLEELAFLIEVGVGLQRKEEYRKHLRRALESAYVRGVKDGIKQGNKARLKNMGGRLQGFSKTAEQSQS